MIYCSLIIPTLDRAPQLRQTLESIRRQSDLSEYELIVVDNGSKDETMDVCASFPDLRLTYIFDTTPGSLTGRHRGAQQALGEVFCFLDDDILLDAGWLRTVKQTFRAHSDIDLLTGPSLPLFETEVPGWLDDFWYHPPGGGRFCSWLSLVDMGEDVQEIDPNLVWSLNFCIRRQAFEELKGFHPDYYGPGLEMFQGDGETGLTMKAIAAGKKALYHPGVRVFHHVPTQRLTKEYFGRRAYFQGIADSFSGLRRGDRGLSIVASFLQKLRGLLRPRRYANVSVRDVRLHTEKQYREGYRFHRKWFRRSASVRDWVKKDNYLDVELPPGWINGQGR